jgi:cyclopropane-fatty-acyl-phospholipid synthase
MLATIVRLAFGRLITRGDLTFLLPDGSALRFGDATGSPVIVSLEDRTAVLELLIRPELMTGELFTDGRLRILQGTIYEFLCLVLSQPDGSQPSGLGRWIEAVRRRLSLWGQQNLPRRSRRNVAHHYDLGDPLYALFLDPDWQYSCAYFEFPGQDLAAAQMAKKRHIAAKLRLRSTDRVLDIGCGWGGMACYLAQTGQVAEAVGVTLSVEQHRRAELTAEARGLAGRARFLLQDYRALSGAYDRIVSVGMFEHVGLAYFPAFFQVCRRLLAEDGVMVLHTIGSSDVPTTTNPWITKHIFPGGYLPSLSDIVPVVERAGLIVTDVEVLRLHYAETLRAWRDAFLARRAEAEAMLGDRFCRMWEYYLSMSEAAFRHEDIVVFQLQLARRQDAVPLTRDYIHQAETALRAKEDALRRETDV